MNVTEPMDITEPMKVTEPMSVAKPVNARDPSRGRAEVSEEAAMDASIVLDFDRRPCALPYMLRAVRPVRRRVTLEPRIVACWHGHRVDTGDLAAFLRMTGLPEGPALPLLYPHVFGFRLSMALLTHPRFPVPIWGVLQTRSHLVQHRPIAAGETLDFEARVAQGRAVARGAEFDLRTTVSVEGELAWESLVTFFTRGRYGEPGPASDLARSPPAPAFAPGNASDLARSQSVPACAAGNGSPGGNAGSFAAGSSATASRVCEWTMRNVGHRRFGRFTGDYNGIHLWDAYARRFGFRRALYHPSRVLGECLARLPAGADGFQPTRLDAWLKGPVPHGAKVRLCAQESADGTTFALYAGEDRPCIVGRVRSGSVSFSPARPR